MQQQYWSSSEIQGTSGPSLPPLKPMLKLCWRTVRLQKSPTMKQSVSQSINFSKRNNGNYCIFTLNVLATADVTDPYSMENACFTWTKNATRLNKKSKWAKNSACKGTAVFMRLFFCLHLLNDCLKRAAQSLKSVEIFLKGKEQESKSSRLKVQITISLSCWVFR